MLEVIQHRSEGLLGQISSGPAGMLHVLPYAVRRLRHGTNCYGRVPNVLGY